MATEIAQAYVSLSVETSAIPRQVASALGVAARGADRSGRDVGVRFAAGMSSAIKGIGPSIAAVAGVGGLAAAFTSVVTTGNNFTNSMNTMRAVSRASAADMSKVSEAARQLANDASLPATSATDAASAMVELAKGGFTVEQSMTAARGTLQLAAAASIDAASAATIQSQALQAFGKDASYAGQTADILANAANASSAEITDVAAALQQSGTVANQFGLSMQDTAAAIAMMANAGIQGSDAGTLLKSALLALTDTSNPAQGAIEELGLTVYDAQGKFVGLERLFGDLDEASKSMTEEQYQAATATLFGSDAMRLAGIAAEQGAEGYTTLVDAMGRQGSAAEVAAAKTEGLPGAWERLKNSIEGASLSIYDVISGPLTAAADSGSGLINRLLQAAETAGPKVGDFFSGIGKDIASAYQTLQDSGKIEEWGNRLANVWHQIADAAENVAPIILQFSAIAAKAAAAMGFAAWEGLLATLESLSTILTVGVVPILQLVADVAGASETATIGLVAAFLLFKTVPAVMGAVRGSLAPLAAQARAASAQIAGLAAAQRAVIQTSAMGAVSMGRFGSAVAAVGRTSPMLARMQQSFVNAAVGANQFSRTAGVAAAAGTGLRSAGAGLAGVFGGPVGLGLTAAAIGGMAWMSSVQKQKAATDAYKSAIESMNEEQTNTASILTKTRGAASTEVYSSLTKQVEDYRSALEAASTADAKWTDNVADGVEKLFTGDSGNTSKKLDEAASKAKSTQEALSQLGLTSADVGAKIGGSAAQWNGFTANLRNLGDGGKNAASDLVGLRNEFLEQQNIARMTTPGITDMQTAMRLLADDTASAADKTNALKSALDALNPARTKGEALAQHNEVMREVADSTKAAFDQTQGFGQSLGGVSGIINGTTANGAELRDELIKIVDATAAAKANGASMGDVNRKNAESFDQLAQKAGVSADEIKRTADELGLSDLNLIIKASGADETIQQLASVRKAFDEQPGSKTINMEMGQITPETEKQLEAFGFKVNAIPGSKMVQIEATDGASPMLDAVLNRVIEIGGLQALPKIDADASQFFLKDQEARNRLGALDLAQAYPEVGVTIDKLLSGSNISMAELQKLDQTVANPQARMEISKILESLGIVNTELDRVASPRTAFIDTVVRGNTSTGSAGYSVPGGGMGPPSSADGSIRQYANGGISALPDHALIQKPEPRGGLVQWAEPETGGEVFIPLAESKRPRSLAIWRKAGELLGVKGMESFADGGVRASDFDELARGGFGARGPLTGSPYDWAGVNWGDCSGAMSAFANLAAGLPVFGSRFATASEADELAKRGARPGRGSLGDLIFGWYNGGEGGGHTAGTLPSGKNVEMGGSAPGGNGEYGGNPNFGMMTDWAHFPASMFGPSWTDPGTDPGGFVIRPDGSIGPVAQSGDYGANGSGSGLSGSSGSSGMKSTSLSGMLGDAASAAVSGQVADLLGIFQINDQPAAITAYNQYVDETAAQNAQWAEAKKSRDDQQAQQQSELNETPATTAPPANITPSAPSAAQVAQDAQINYDSSKGAEQWDPYMLRVLKKLTLPDGLLSKFREQVDIESGGDPLAVNEGYNSGGNPSGLTQTLPGTFNAFKSGDFADNIFDPLANLFAGANYVQNDPKYAGRGMEAIWPTTAGYWQGGKVGGVAGRDKNLAWLTKDEFVHTPEDYSRNQWAVDAIHAGATLKPAVGGGGESNAPRVTYNIQAGNTERAFNEAQRLEKRRTAVGLGRY